MRILAVTAHPAAAVAPGTGAAVARHDRRRLLRTPDEGGAYLAVEETVLFTRVVEGRFPDIDREIPLEWRTPIVVETASFRHSVREIFPEGDGEILGVAEAGASHESARVWTFLRRVEVECFRCYEVDEYGQVACGMLVVS